MPLVASCTFVEVIARDSSSEFAEERRLYFFVAPISPAVVVGIVARISLSWRWSQCFAEARRPWCALVVYLVAGGILLLMN